MIFIGILIITTLAIAGSAAFFSIYGLAAIFTGAFWPVVVMATSLEAGKLVAASYVYRYWERLTLAMKAYLLAAIVVLMIITSAGIFGFLSSAYQKDILPLEQKQQQIQLLQQEKQELTDLKQERLERRKQIDADIASLPNNFVTGRQRLMTSYGPELEQIREDIANYTQQVRDITTKMHNLKAETLEQRTHTGPIIFIAKVFNAEVDTATKWVILLIIFAFDPLAVILTVGANIAVLERSGGKKSLFYQEPVKEHEEVDATFEVHTGMTIEQLEKMLDEINNKHRLSPEQIIQKQFVEEMLRKKKVTENLRNPNS